jgi:hypothetical protein
VSGGHSILHINNGNQELGRCVVPGCRRGDTESSTIMSDLTDKSLMGPNGLCCNYLIYMCITCISMITYNSTYMDTILTHGLGEHYLL